MREQYAEVYGEGTNAGHKQSLVRRLVRRMQALEERDLSERMRRRSQEHADDAYERTLSARPKFEPILARSPSDPSSFFAPAMRY